jgi:hypothetical protein
MKKNMEILFDARNEVDLRLNTKEGKYMFISHHQERIVILL